MSEMTHITDYELELHTRDDGSDYLAIGNPVRGPYEQFNFNGSHEIANEIVSRFNSHASLVEENKRMRELLSEVVRVFDVAINIRDFAYVSGTDLREEIAEVLEAYNA